MILRILLNLIHDFKPDLWITNVFPNGLFQELPNLIPKFNFNKIITVRILKTEQYRIYSEIEYHEAWQIEWLPDYMNSYLLNLALKNIAIHLKPLQNHEKIVQNKQ